MNKKSILFLILLLPVFICSGQEKPVIRPELRILEPLLGKTWHAIDTHPRTQQALHHIFWFEPLQEGKILKYNKYCKEMNIRSDGYYYFDPDKEEIAFVELSSNGNYSKGHLKIEDGKLLKYGWVVFPGRKHELRNTLEINPDGSLQDDFSWFNGYNWQAGHSRLYSPRKMDNDKSDIEQTIHNAIGWALEKDFDLFFNTISNDSDYLCVTPYERIKYGINDVKADTAFWANPDFKAVGHELHDLKINLPKNKNVAWFSCILDDYNTWKGNPANWEKVRWTGVLEKREGKWRLVQQHFSWPKNRD